MTDLFKSIIKKRLSDLGYDTSIKEWEAVSLWEKIAGKRLAAVSTAEKVRNHVLYVSVKNSSWAHHLSLMKRDFLLKLNESLDQNTIKDIKFSIFSYKGISDLGSTGIDRYDDEPAQKDLDSIQIDEQSIEEIEKSISSIGDKKLQEVFKRVQIKDRRKKIWEKEHATSFCPVCRTYIDGEGICPVCHVKLIKNPDFDGDMK